MLMIGIQFMLYFDMDAEYIFYYSAKNSTLIEPYQALEHSFPSFIFDTSNDQDGYIKLNIPKNFLHIITQLLFLYLMIQILILLK